MMGDQHLQAMLTRLRDEAQFELERLERDLEAFTRSRIGENDDDEHDPEGVPLSAEWSRLSGVTDAARQRVHEADSALANLACGEYGRCAECGRDIPRERLEVRPFASHCVPCAERLGS